MSRNHPAAPRAIDQLRSATPDGRPYKFLFICGHMRSGTNWVCNILRGHPDISVHGEGPFGLFCGALLESKRHSWLYSSRDADIQRVLEESFHDLIRNTFLQLATLAPTCSWVADSTSRQLWPYLPGTHHIHIQRDCRDVLTSWTFHQLGLGLPIGEPWKTRLAAHAEALRLDPEHFKKHPEELLSDEPWVRFVARGWREFIDTAAAARRRTAAGTLDMKLLDLVYEDMLASAGTAQARIFRFLDLDPALAAALSDEHRTTAGFDREDPTSHFRAGRRGDWEKYATDDLRRWIKEEVGQTLIEAGYERDLNW